MSSLILSTSLILAPIFAVIITGNLLRSWHFPGDGFWKPAEDLTYYLLFPALLLQKISSAPEITMTVLPLTAALTTTVMVISFLLLISRKLLARDGSAFTSIYQGTVRFNTYIGLSIILPLYGNTGIVQAAVVIAILIPLVNLLSVIVLAHFGNTPAADGKQIVPTLAKNPVFIACITGILLNLLRIPLPGALNDLFSILGRASLTLGLLTVGAGLDIISVKNSGKQVLLTTGMRLLMMPALMWFSCSLFGVAGAAEKVAILFAALPGSALSFVLARQMGGDSKLMANIVTVQTCFSIITLPVVIAMI